MKTLRLSRPLLAALLLAVAPDAFAWSLTAGTLALPG